MSDARGTSTMTSTWLLIGGLCAIFLGERIFGEGGARDLLTYGGGAALLASAGLRLRAFSASTGDVRGVEARLLACYGGVALTLVLYGLTTEAGQAVLGSEDEGVQRLVGALSVLWPAGLLVALMALLFIELVYLRMPVARSVELRRVRTSLHAGLSLAFAVVFLLSINYVAVERDVRKDVSYFKTTEPGEGSRSQVQKLEAPITAYLFYREASDVLSRVQPYFDVLARGSDKLTVEVVDVALVPDLARKHKVRDNGHVLLVKGEGDDARGESFRVGTKLTEARRVLKKLDASFQEAFSKLVRPERVLFLTVGHGERNAKSSELKAADGTAAMQDILKRLNLKTENVGVGEGLGNAVPDGASAVAVIGPSKPFLPEEVESLLSYVREGGRLMLMLDPDVDAGDVGLTPLVEGLGMEQLPGVISSDKHYMRRTHNASDRAVVFSNAYNSHPAVTTANRHSREVATVFYRGTAFKKRGEAAPGAPKVVFPLRSKREFWLDTDGDFERGEGEKESAKMMIGASVFQNEGGTDGRALVIGDGDFITNKLAGNGGNVLVFVDGLAWLVGNEELAAEVTSEEDVPIEHTSEEDKVWFYGTTFAVPAPVALLGLWVARRRRRKAEANP
ncbi:MAG: Gldg family protein [Myxococcales bacterium]|nr:Gldg family protein [Myxococcales bacterium]